MWLEYYTVQYLDFFTIYELHYINVISRLFSGRVGRP